MAKKNLKNTPLEPEDEKSTSNQKDKKSSSDRGKVSGIRAFFQDHRTRKITGIFLTFFSVYLFLACFSYLFSGGSDQYLLAGGDTTAENGTPHYANWMGKTGAWSAHLLMYRFFGIGIFFVAFMFFLYGVKIVTKKSLFPLFKSLRLSVLGMLYFPLLIGFLFHRTTEMPIPQIELTCNDRFVGGYGFFATQWTLFTLGWFGTLMLLVFVLGAFLIFNFNHQMEAFRARLSEWWTMRKKATANTKENNQNRGEEPILSDDTTEKNIIKNEVNFPADLDDEMKEETPGNEIDESAVDQSNEVDFFVTSIPPIESPPMVSPENAEQLPFETEGLGIEVQHTTTEEELPDSEIEKRLQEFGEYDPKLDLSRYVLPSIDLLKQYNSSGPQITKDELEENKNKIVDTLNQYKIEIARIKATIGPTVTLYEIVPAPGVRISKIKNLEDDIALSLAALGIRIIAPIPGKGTIGIEVPNSRPDIVSMRSLIASEKFQNADMDLPIVLGKTISNEIFVTDLAKMPHLLMAGATGQGKSVGLNAILVSLLYKKHPSQVKLVLVDPKKVELTLFNKIERHFLAKLPEADEPIITDTAKVVKTLSSLCVEMDSRYELLKLAGCRNIKEYNTKFIKRRLNPENGHRYLPYIVLVVDEFADLIMTAGREVEMPIARLAQLARAVGIHLIIATQRPSVNIITGTIKANFPARIAFRVTSKIDSRTILDAGGADQLIGRGDMLFSTGNDLIRLQCGFVDTPEVDEITEFIGNQQGYPQAFLLPEVEEESNSEVGNFTSDDRDELFEEAARIIVLNQQGSASLLQRKLKLGYNRAGRLIDQLAIAGLIGPPEGSKARKVLIADEASLEQFLLNVSREQRPF